MLIYMLIMFISKNKFETDYLHFKKNNFKFDLLLDPEIGNK